jgi:hypothetical protein
MIMMPTIREQAHDHEIGARSSKGGQLPVDPPKRYRVRRGASHDFLDCIQGRSIGELAGRAEEVVHHDGVAIIGLTAEGAVFPELRHVVDAHLDHVPVEHAVSAVNALPDAGGAQLRGQDRRLRAGNFQVLAR